ncbi:unnamed protein product [Vitrella brassicaformis CCMP3155]|uniref:Uncharacterized protein n=1 Tax=Vitrella brassicaformis (strain CCMP3155) TaxID=1169540 RepID=A0A0G4EJC2_VITBC|nr:unnamed protein product [Vitrella brassicaformis CCMP3155]|eukprot:CEL96597.1 unnamed protein product [Vitrella brassicaformis CCMP3155]
MEARGLVLEIFVIVCWYLGSAMHSVITKTALRPSSTEMSLADRVFFGSLVTSLQLCVAGFFAIPFLLFYRKSLFEGQGVRGTFMRFLNFDFFFSSCLYALANICANTALGGGRVLLVQIIKCSELIITTILAWLIAGTAAPTAQIAALSLSSFGIILVVHDTVQGGSGGSGSLIAVFFALLGALSISLRNVLVSKKGEGATIPFFVLSVLGCCVACLISLCLFMVGAAPTSVSIPPALLSGLFHSTYNMASLGFLAMVSSPIVHAYFNAVKRAVIIITAEVLRCGLPTGVQILGSFMAIIGLHLSKSAKPKKAPEKEVLKGHASQGGGRYPNWWSLLGALVVCLVFWHTAIATRCSSDAPIMEAIKNIASPENLNSLLGASTVATANLKGKAKAPQQPANTGGAGADAQPQPQPPPAPPAAADGEEADKEKVVSQNVAAASMALPQGSSGDGDGDQQPPPPPAEDQQPPEQGEQAQEVGGEQQGAAAVAPRVDEAERSRTMAVSQKILEERTWEGVIGAQQEAMIDAYSALVKGYKRAMMFGLADHENKGDAAINYGQYLVLKKLGLEVVHFCAPKLAEDCDYDEALRVAQSSDDPLIIFYTGGGNFGDIWQKYVDDRERLVARFRDHPEYPIVVFPQTIKFEHDDTMVAHAEKMRHPNISFIARDIPSYEWLMQCPFEYKMAYMLPDSAFMMGVTPPPISPTYDILWVKRTDREKRDYKLPPAPKGVKVKQDDWVSYNSTNIKWREKYPVRNGEGYEFFQTVVTKSRLNRGLQFLARGNVVVADRLHAHILCTLMRKPHVILDNNYGKIRQYRSAWTDGLVEGGLVHIATTPEEAMDKALAILKGTTQQLKQADSDSGKSAEKKDSVETDERSGEGEGEGEGGGKEKVQA